MSIGMAYNIKKRNSKMAKGGMAHCSHGGPAYCNAGCYADGGMVDSEDAADKAMSYEKAVDEPMDEMQNKPVAEMPNSMKSAASMFKGKSMAKRMMAKGGMVDADNQDIDVALTTPHDDFMSDEENYDLVGQEDYEEGRQAKEKRMGGLMARVMSKLHNR